MSGAIIIGAGPGVGLSVARRFAQEGFPVGVVARSRATIDRVLSSLAHGGTATLGVTADAADESALRAALDKVVARFGVPDVLVYNAALIQWDSVGDLSSDQHLRAWAVNVVGAITAAAYHAPRMAEAGRDTIVITGGMPAPVPQATSLSLGKAGVRALTDLLSAQFGAQGVHVATVTICGVVAPGTAFDPDEIAEHYWRLHTQPPDAWQREVVYAGDPNRKQGASLA